MIGSNLPAKTRKAYANLLAIAGEANWTVEITGSGHVRWLHPDGKTQVFSSCTPGDHRAYQNVIRDLRHHGLIINIK